MYLLPTYLHVSYKFICTISTIGAQNRREKNRPEKIDPNSESRQIQHHREFKNHRKLS